MSTSPDISALSLYAGTNESKLIGQLLNGLDIVNDIMVRQNIKTQHRLGKLTVGKGARPYSSTEQFKGDPLAYTDRFLSVDEGKRELRINPKEYRDSYLSEFLPTGSGAKQKTIPFAQFTWQKVLEKLAEELNDFTAYDGFDKTIATAYDPSSTYSVADKIIFFDDYYECISATTAGQSPTTHAAKWNVVNAEAITKGLGTIIAQEITASNISPVALGAISTGAEALAAAKELFRSFTTPYRRNGVVIHMSYTDFDFLMDGIESVTNNFREDVTEGKSFGQIYVPGTNRKCVAKAATWMPNSRRLIAEPMAMIGGQVKGTNLHMGTDLQSDFNEINIVESELWSIKAGISWLMGFQIADLEALKVGDQV